MHDMYIYNYIYIFHMYKLYIYAPCLSITIYTYGSGILYHVSCHKIPVSSGLNYIPINGC